MRKIWEGNPRSENDTAEALGIRKFYLVLESINTISEISSTKDKWQELEQDREIASDHERTFMSCKHFLFYLEGCRGPLKEFFN